MYLSLMCLSCPFTASICCLCNIYMHNMFFENKGHEWSQGLPTCKCRWTEGHGPPPKKKKKSVVSVLISLISDTWLHSHYDIKLIFGLRWDAQGLLCSLHGSARYCSPSGIGPPQYNDKLEKKTTEKLNKTKENTQSFLVRIAVHIIFVCQSNTCGFWCRHVTSFRPRKWANQKSLYWE